MIGDVHSFINKALAEYHTNTFRLNKPKTISLSQQTNTD